MTPVSEKLVFQTKHEIPSQPAVMLTVSSLAKAKPVFNVYESSLFRKSLFIKPQVENEE